MRKQYRSVTNGIASFSITGVDSVLQLIEVESEDLQLTGRVIGQFKKVV
ncbi:hypothetical protein [Bacillus tropicus]|nr:hypothetical protein [Bacillus tropicus]USK94708.1 hypothetical protein LIS81_14315 [Bacillus tropicus]HEF1903752.1 hypothetical protein [Bacillus cereus]